MISGSSDSAPHNNESMVSFVSRRYMRAVNGSLVVCLSEYLPLGSLYPCDKSLNRHA